MHTVARIVGIVSRGAKGFQPVTTPPRRRACQLGSADPQADHASQSTRLIRNEAEVPGCFADGALNFVSAWRTLGSAGTHASRNRFSHPLHEGRPQRSAPARAWPMFAPPAPGLLVCRAAGAFWAVSSVAAPDPPPAAHLCLPQGPRQFPEPPPHAPCFDFPEATVKPAPGDSSEPLWDRLLAPHLGAQGPIGAPASYCSVPPVCPSATTATSPAIVTSLPPRCRNGRFGAAGRARRWPVARTSRLDRPRPLADRQCEPRGPHLRRIRWRQLGRHPFHALQSQPVEFTIRRPHPGSAATPDKQAGAPHDGFDGGSR